MYLLELAIRKWKKFFCTGTERITIKQTDRQLVAWSLVRSLGRLLGVVDEKDVCIYYGVNVDFTPLPVLFVIQHPDEFQWSITNTNKTVGCRWT